MIHGAGSIHGSGNCYGLASITYLSSILTTIHESGPVTNRVHQMWYMFQYLKVLQVHSYMISVQIALIHVAKSAQPTRDEGKTMCCATVAVTST